MTPDIRKGSKMPGVMELAIIAVIVIMIFGSKRIRQLGNDLGGMIKGFRSGFKELEIAEPEIEELKRDFRDAKATIERIES